MCVSAARRESLTSFVQTGSCLRPGMLVQASDNVRRTYKNVTWSAGNGIYRSSNPIGAVMKNTNKASVSAVMFLACFFVVGAVSQGAEKAGSGAGVRVGAASAEFEADDSMIIAGGIAAGKATS